MTYLPEGCAHPTTDQLEAFWNEARASRPDAGLETHYQVRWIGLDDETHLRILS